MIYSYHNNSKGNIMSNTTHKLVKVSAKSLIHCRFFTLGYKHATNNQKFDPQYDHWTAKDQWSYERGRQYARIDNGQIPPKNGKAVNPLAVKLLSLAHYNNLIL